MMKYRCFPCDVYWELKQLLKRKDCRHIDYVCPKCEKVIICNEAGR